MTSTEIQKVIEQLRKHYMPNQAVPPEMAQAWINAFRMDNREAVIAAVQPCIEGEEFFPKIAKFREYISMESRKAQRVAPSKECADCEGSGWKESTVVETATGKRPTKGADGKMDGPMEAYEFTYPPGVYPCPTCEPARYDRWHDQWVPEANRNRPVKVPDLLPANPRKGLAQARAALAAADQLTKDADSL